MRTVRGFESCCRLLTLACLAFLYGTISLCGAQTHDVLCVQGGGNFSAIFHTGVAAHVGAAKNGGLAARACEAGLNWGDQGLVVVSEASEVDLDAFGVDLGLGVPVVAFQIQKSDNDLFRSYQIYSLQKPPRLLRTITGGDFFSASDTDLDARVEVWTDDAAAVVGFDNLSLSELDFAPPVVLRFVHNQLLDVGSEFQPYFDHLIANLKAQLDPQDLHDFKNSDGKLSPTLPFPAERMHRLRSVKVKSLEVVWTYLYSSREQDAWKALADMWPIADVQRVRAALILARNRGIRAQVDGVSAALPPTKRKHAPIFDAVSKSEHGPSQLIPPQPILLRRPPPSAAEQGLARSEMFLDLLIDSAGKVRSADSAGTTKSVDADLMNAAMEWEFIPAFRDGRSVACKLRIAVSARR